MTNKDLMGAFIKSYEGTQKRMKKAIILLMVLLLPFISYGQDAYSYIKKGSEKLDRKDNRGAIVDYTTAIKLDPESRVSRFAYSYRGLAKYELGDHRGAIADFTRAIELTDPNKKGLLSEYYNNRGVAKESLKDYSGAIVDYTTAIKLDPEVPVRYYNRGRAKIINNQKESGCLDLSKAGELGDPDAYEAIRSFCN